MNLFGDVVLKEAEEEFCHSVGEILNSFVAKCKSPQTVLLFDECTSRGRFLVHKCTELVPALKSVSIGTEPDRRVVVYAPTSSVAVLEHHPTQLVSRKRPFNTMPTTPRSSRRPDKQVYVPKHRRLDGDAMKQENDKPNVGVKTPKKRSEKESSTCVNSKKNSKDAKTSISNSKEPEENSRIENTDTVENSQVDKNSDANETEKLPQSESITEFKPVTVEKTATSELNKSVVLNSEHVLSNCDSRQNDDEEGCIKLIINDLVKLAVSKISEENVDQNNEKSNKNINDNINSLSEGEIIKTSPENRNEENGNPETSNDSQVLKNESVQSMSIDTNDAKIRTKKEKKEVNRTKKRSPKNKSKTKEEKNAKIDEDKEEGNKGVKVSELSANGECVKMLSTEEGDDWETSWNEVGECLNDDMKQELSNLTGIKKPVVKKASVIDYLEFKTKDINLDDGEFGHIVELFDFSPVLKSQDLFNALTAAGVTDYNITWVDDTHALAVFASRKAAHGAIKSYSPLLQMKQVVDGTNASKLKARSLKEVLLPYKKRPASTGAVARNLISGALGIRTNLSPEQRQKERQLLRGAKDEKRRMKQQKQDIWEGE